MIGLSVIYLDLYLFKCWVHFGTTAAAENRIHSCFPAFSREQHAHCYSLNLRQVFDFDSTLLFGTAVPWETGFESVLREVCPTHAPVWISICFLYFCFLFQFRIVLFPTILKQIQLRNWKHFISLQTSFVSKCSVYTCFYQTLVLVCVDRLISSLCNQTHRFFSLC